MNVADLTGVALDYWVARSLHDFVREIYFTDSGETVSIRGNDRGRPWDGRFTPSASWATAAVVLERVRRLDVREQNERGAVCVAEFEGGRGAAEARGESLRIAMLRAFVASHFGAVVDDVLRERQALNGMTVETISEQTVGGVVEDLPRPDGQIGDIQSPPR
ncbi:DUF2591 domain-containing protein [Paraburkholderia sp. MMS20-SJTR3]|uniref:DUF2591 domain-containing protein n=1 Tax=Paraburkholderia sejongensis TaxID=2886946 RepID=A0ABS8JZ80_9BURK|nr:phage protein NinX family protein [Paraburkholderia sp. MMS20-SJTR3]MCC8395133.1 DUF2591 domain-containing protein [Paraburkholderia sp. MMS20-SJTR3]